MVAVRSLLVTAFAVLTLAAPALDVGPAQPSDDTFYALPSPGDLNAAKPGQILRYRTPPQPISALGIKPLNLKSSHQLLYKSIDSLGNDTATVLADVVPHNADYHKVVSYQVAEDAAWITCATSYALQFGSHSKLFGTTSTQAELAVINGAL